EIQLNVSEKDKNFIYNLKKTSIFHYADKTWGWDEEYQIKDFENDFNTTDLKIVVVVSNRPNS
ncbi:MAG: hypothetical protein GXZ06_09720, partial [Tissierellia bacterium]|nr:hypothetical protein [Tissierellia bacterium]